MFRGFFKKFQGISSQVQWPWSNYEANNGVIKSLITQNIDQIKKKISELFKTLWNLF